MTAHSSPTRIRIDEGWRACRTSAESGPPGASAPLDWEAVTIPHNFEHYHGYVRVTHGNLHGTAWYQRPLAWDPAWSGREVFVHFEGVGSYADVWLNGIHVGHHAGGRTSFTVRLTPALRAGESQLLEVRAHHPEKIDDLPFVCGGCWGAPNTEGSQPFGIFRPVHLEITGPVRVEPFGVHVWTPEVSPAFATVETRTELRSYASGDERVVLRHRLLDPDGAVIDSLETTLLIPAGAEKLVVLRFGRVESPRLWQPDSPALYRVETTLHGSDGDLLHAVSNRFGIRRFSWPRILQPEIDHNSSQSDPSLRIVDLGDAPPSPVNNGYTVRTAGSEDAPCRLAPMGVRVRPRRLANDVSHVAVELEFEASTPEDFQVELELLNDGGTVFLERHSLLLSGGPGRRRIVQESGKLFFAHFWSNNDPYLYKAVVTLRDASGTLLERSETPFRFYHNVELLNCGRPTVERSGDVPPTPAHEPGEPRTFLWNGQSVFHNGSAEYEHLLGRDHAFSDAQIDAEIAMFRAAGFNAFRDAHHPHNLRYYDRLDEAGLLCWTQIGSHIYFDTEAFRENHRRIVREWVRERRNHPCIAIWGLQNESLLPREFARELRALIMELDPTCPAERITATCNGGKGSDWNVPQEWSGTYGSNCNHYNLAALQLVGEFGAWRTLRQHTGADCHGDENDRSETYADYLLETKLRRGWEQRDQAIGHYQWIFASFQNPGRSPECTEGFGNDAIGPINNKGLLTVWREPSDSFFLYRANFAPRHHDPMVYIVSHTWPDRFASGPARAKLRVYSNCEEVELFNGVTSSSFGRIPNPGVGRHFQWPDALVRFGLLRAVGYVGGKPVAWDAVLLNGLPPPADLEELYTDRRDTTAPPVNAGRALYRVNCGGGAFVDHHGQTWSADQEWGDGATWGCLSWGRLFATVPDDIASRGRIHTPIQGTFDEPLYQTFRYGREFLEYRFAVPPGDYLLRLHFAEPWYGVGGGQAAGWRVFDVAVNNRTLLRDLDLWRTAGGPSRAWTHCAPVRSENGLLRLHFPRVEVNQAVIQGIEIFAGA